jgi:hypothetical protein
MTWTQFLFGEQHWHDILGWHVAVFIALIIGWQISKQIHKP